MLSFSRCYSLHRLSGQLIFSLVYRTPEYKRPSNPRQTNQRLRWILLGAVAKVQEVWRDVELAEGRGGTKYNKTFGSMNTWILQILQYGKGFPRLTSPRASPTLHHSHRRWVVSWKSHDCLRHLRSVLLFSVETSHPNTF